MNAKPCDPRCEMSPNLTDIVSNRNCHSFSTDWITNAIFQLKTVKMIAGTS